MKLITTITISLGLIASAAADHHEKPIDLTGVWNGKASTDDGSREYKVTFKKDGDKWTGQSEDASDGTTAKFDRIKVEKKKLTLEIDAEQDGVKGIIRLIAEMKSPTKFAGKWEIVDSEGTELMSGDYSAEKEISYSLPGEWASVATLPDGGELKAKLTVDKKMAGKFDGERGEMKLSSAKAEKNTVRLAFPMDLEGVEHEGVIEAEFKEEHKLAGKWVLKNSDGEVASGDWTATRDPGLDLAGAWDVTAQLPDGNEYKGSTTVSKDGDTYKGKSAGADGESRDLKSVTVDGKNVTFTVDFPIGDDTGLITIKAKSTDKPNELVGTWTLTSSDGTEVASDAWKAVKK